MARRRTSTQISLPFRTRGGARRGAGRKAKGPKAGVRHLRRPDFSARHPIFVTLKLRSRDRPDLADLRQTRRFRILRGALAIARSRLGARICHFSVQDDHLHLLLEASDRRALSRALQGLCIRIAKRLNAAVGGKGAVFADRYHARPLRTPTEVRNSLAYTLCNFRHHAAERGETLPPNVVDGRSSAMWFNGWRGSPRRLTVRDFDPLDGHRRPVVPPETWLLRVGWQRAKAGLVALDEVPG